MSTANQNNPRNFQYKISKPSDGLIPLEGPKDTLYVRGIVYELIPKEINGVIKEIRKRRFTSPEYQQNLLDQEYNAIGVKSGKICVVIGAVKSRKALSQASFDNPPLPSLMGEVQGDPITDNAPEKQVESSSKASKGKKSDLIERYNQQLEIIRAQLDAGLDPQLRLSFIGVHLQESPSNIYKKIGEGKFPRPIKRGRASYWLFSEIELYKNGGWPPPAPAMPING